MFKLSGGICVTVIYCHELSSRDPKLKKIKNSIHIESRSNRACSNRARSKGVCSLADYLSQQRKTVIFVNVENEMVVTSQKALGSFAPQQLMSRELSG